MHIRDTNDLAHIHTILTANLGQFVRKSDIDVSEGVLDHLGHFSRANVRHGDLALAERSIQIPNALAHRPIIGTDCAVVEQQFLHHIAWYNALWRVNQMNIFPNGKSAILDNRPHKPINRAWRNR